MKRSELTGRPAGSGRGWNAGAYGVGIGRSRFWLGRSLGLSVGLALLAGVCGCPPPRGKPVPPQSREQALSGINANLRKIDRPLRASGSVSFRFKDAHNKTHNVPAQDASLTFVPVPAPPAVRQRAAAAQTLDAQAQSGGPVQAGEARSGAETAAVSPERPGELIFDVRSLGGTVAQFGSTAERYWLWVDVQDFRKLWWGEWARIGPATESRLPIPPNELFDALMLRALPAALEGGLRPLLRVADTDYRLLFVRLGADGQPAGWRELRLDSRPPYYPVAITDRTADGAVVMEAQLSRYEPIGKNGPATPRRYLVRWPLNDAEMKLDISRIRFLEEPPTPILFPSRWKYEQEQVDLPAPAGEGAEEP